MFYDFFFETQDLQDLRFDNFIVLRAFTLNTFTIFKLSFVGYLLNLLRAFFLCFIASLQSSLYHGLLFVGFVEVFGIHLEDISIREKVKSDKGFEESLKFSVDILFEHKQ